MAEVRRELLEGDTLLRLTFENGKGNILTGAVMEELSRALAAHESDRRLRLVVLQGANGVFSFGASVEEHRKDTAPAMLHALSRLVRRIALFPAPVAAVVEGRCLGGAFELALACHLIFVTPQAQLGCPEVKLGVFPPVLAALGPWRLGGALSERLLLTGETLAGSDAQAFARVLAPGADPFAAVFDWFRSTLAPLSAAALRNAVLASRRAAHVQDLLGECDRMAALYEERVLPSHDGNEGIEAFVARRPPRWEDA